jgi:hypothetical protein
VPICDVSITVSENHVTFHNTSFTVTIPADVGPSGSFYALHASVFQTNGETYGAEISSGTFELTGATGNWSQSQLEDYTLWSADGYPCSSFACVKVCSDTFWRKNNNSDEYEKCANNCRDVSMTSDSGATATRVASTPAACVHLSTSTVPTVGYTSTSSTSITSPSPTSAARPSLHCPPLWILLTGLLISGSAYLSP